MIFAFAGVPHPYRGVGDPSPASVYLNSNYTLFALALIAGGALYWWHEGEKRDGSSYRRNRRRRSRR